jgi:O-phosphoseryl-tRNA(Cys) synthetase
LQRRSFYLLCMRFSLAYNEDGSILTTPLGDEDAPRLARTGDTSDLFDTTYQLRDVELNEAMEGMQDEMATRQFI